MQGPSHPIFELAAATAVALGVRLFFALASETPLSHWKRPHDPGPTPIPGIGRSGSCKEFRSKFC